MAIIDIYGEYLRKYSNERLLCEYNYQYSKNPESIRTIYCEIELKSRGLLSCSTVNEQAEELTFEEDY